MPNRESFIVSLTHQGKETNLSIKPVEFFITDVQMVEIQDRSQQSILPGADWRTFSIDYPWRVGDDFLTLSIRPQKGNPHALLFLNATQEEIEAYWRFQESAGL